MTKALHHVICKRIALLIVQCTLSWAMANPMLLVTTIHQNCVFLLPMLIVWTGLLYNIPSLDKLTNSVLFMHHTIVLSLAWCIFRYYFEWAFLVDTFAWHLVVILSLYVTLRSLHCGGYLYVRNTLVATLYGGVLCMMYGGGSQHALRVRTVMMHISFYPLMFVFVDVKPETWVGMTIGPGEVCLILCALLMSLSLLHAIETQVNESNVSNDILYWYKTQAVCVRQSLCPPKNCCW